MREKEESGSKRRTREEGANMWGEDVFDRKRLGGADGSTNE
jgi:hypothetical protein